MTADPTGFDPVPAQGTGAEEFSLPERFYLTHQKLIEEWAGLRRTATSAQDNWLQEHVEPAIADLAEQRGLDHAYVVNGRWRSSLLVLPNTSTQGGRPLVGIGLGWSSTDLSPPFVGIDVDLESPHGKATREAVLSNGGRDLRAANAYKSEQRWPAWRYLKLPAHWWNDLDATLEMLSTGVTSTFEIFEQHLTAGATVGLAAADETIEPGTAGPSA